jgi:hypothetical protein
VGAAPSNPRMQRTPSAPLMRKPLGDVGLPAGIRDIGATARIATLAVALSIILFRQGQACSCLDYPTPTEALKKSGLVFSGEVVSVQVVLLPHVVYTENQKHELVPSQSIDRVGLVTLRTLKEWKGNGAKEYLVLAAAPPVTPLPAGMVLVGDCRSRLELGKRYLVFATEGFTEADPCAPTGDLDSSQATVAALDAHARSRTDVKKERKAKS